MAKKLEWAVAQYVATLDNPYEVCKIVDLSLDDETTFTVSELVEFFATKLYYKQNYGCLPEILRLLDDAVADKYEADGENEELAASGE